MMRIHRAAVPAPARQITIVTLLACVALSAFLAKARAQAQPKPGPEHKKIEIAVGEWTHEGSTEATPLGPAQTYAVDGQTATITAEYSPDEGRTWLPLWKGTTKRVGK